MKAAAILSVGLASLFGTGLCQADTKSHSVFDGKYDDPNHPSCDRKIVTDSIYGADAAGGEGAACDGETDIAWGPIPAAINATSIIADFSSKGGPSELHGKYNFESNAIDWEDGNAWTKLGRN
jgi:hypothetical protein